jgi:hypothetical protein
MAVLTALTKLYLGLTKVGDGGVEALTALPVLSFLNLLGTQDRVSDTGMRALASFIPCPSPFFCQKQIPLAAMHCELCSAVELPMFIEHLAHNGTH